MRPRRAVHGRKFELLFRLVHAGQEPALLLVVADGKVELDEVDAIVQPHLF
jgi:hypothetical protein